MKGEGAHFMSHDNLSAESYVSPRPLELQTFQRMTTIVRICELIFYRALGIENQACNSDEYIINNAILQCS